MEYLEILSDSTLVTSLEHSYPNAIYNVKHDTLFIKYAYTWYGPNNSSGYKVEYHPYKIIKNSIDTIILKHHYDGITGLSDSREETFEFVNLEKYKQTVNDFKFLKMDYANPLGGGASITIDSTGEINYFNTPGIVDKVYKSAKKKDLENVYFTPSEFENFKNVLSKSMIEKLPALRGCAIDEPHREFVIKMRNKTFITKGCRMYYPQQLLFNYLYQLDKNTGIIDKRENK